MFDLVLKITLCISQGNLLHSQPHYLVNLMKPPELQIFNHFFQMPPVHPLFIPLETIFQGGLKGFLIFPRRIKREHWEDRSSRSQMFIDVLENFTNFTEKHLCWSFFLINFRPVAYTSSKKRLQNRCFLCDLLYF